MFFILKTFMVFIISIQLASIISSFLLMGFLGIKTIFQRMTQERWQKYFEKIGFKGLQGRLNFCFFLTLLMIALTDTVFFFNNITAYGVALLIAGLFHLSFESKVSNAEDLEKFTKK